MTPNFGDQFPAKVKGVLLTDLTSSLFHFHLVDKLEGRINLGLMALYMLILFWFSYCGTNEVIL